MTNKNIVLHLNYKMKFSIINFYQKKWKILKIIVISFIIVFPIRYFILSPFTVNGSSMEPSFKNEDYLIADKISYAFRNPKRGEIIIFTIPPGKIFIKRIVGIPNETVQIKDGGIFIYNKKQGQWIKLSESYLLPKTKTFPDSKIVLDKNEYFVLGDNRKESADSRVFGAIPSKNIIGRVFIRLWPLSKITIY